MLLYNEYILIKIKKRNSQTKNELNLKIKRGKSCSFLTGKKCWYFLFKLILLAPVMRIAQLALVILGCWQGPRSGQLRCLEEGSSDRVVDILQHNFLKVSLVMFWD
jgi:hypothetical protein